ncbi:MAG: diaminopimelate epimerase [Eubacterium ramulus]
MKFLKCMVLEMISFLIVLKMGTGHAPVWLNAERVQKLCDRHYWIGADGVICDLPSKVADFRMLICNADGSRAQMCGNGIRCIGKYVSDHGRTDRKELTVETDAGIRRLVLKEENGKVEYVEVDMGIPEFDPEKIPVRGVVEPLVQREISVADRIFPVTCLSMGNPHCVVFVEDTEQFEVLRYGPLLERHELSQTESMWNLSR